MKAFENPEVQVKIFAAEDIMTTSNDGPYQDENYTPWG